MTGREGHSDRFNVYSAIGTFKVGIEYSSKDLEELLLLMGHIAEATPMIISSALKLKPHCVEYDGHQGKRTKVTRLALPNNEVCAGCKVAQVNCPIRMVWEDKTNLSMIDSTIRDRIIVV